MSDEKNSPAKTNNLDDINKHKILISKKDYQEKHTNCIGWVFPQGAVAFLGTMVLVPYALKSIPFINLTLELRLLTGLLSTVPLSYLVIKRSKERCENHLENTYYYRIKN